MNCERCGGFKVFEFFYGPELCNGFRCVNCGASTMRRVMPVRPSERPQRRIQRVQIKASPCRGVDASGEKHALSGLS